MLIQMGYDNKHIIGGRLYENLSIGTDEQESDADLLERVTGYAFAGIESKGIGLDLILMDRAGEFINAPNICSLLDRRWNFVFEL